MALLRFAASVILLVAVTFVFADHAAAQRASGVSAARSQWSQRVLGRGRSQTVGPAGSSPDTFQAVLDEPADAWTEQQSVATAAYDQPLLSEVMMAPPDETLEPLAIEGDFLNTETCASCGEADEAYGPNYYENYGVCHQLWVQCTSRWLSRFNYFTGVQGFKGPVDQGANGNFGFHEGLNWGAPLGDPWGIGYQVGVEAVHSNFSGDQVAGVRRSGRDQVFLTGGFFRRPPRGGLQWGVVFDLLHDSYYDNSDTAQIRTELSLVRPEHHEIGFSGAFAINDDDFGNRVIEPIDIFSIFYRRYFSGGGQGNFWTGLSDRGDTLFGAGLTIPLGESCALRNNFTYLLPQQGRGLGGQQREAWAVMIQLVWYPGRDVQRVLKDPYHPLFGVADNSSFLLDRR